MVTLWNSLPPDVAIAAYLVEAFMCGCQIPQPRPFPPLLEFHGLEESMLLRALQALQQDHKAEIITLDDGRGVKFF